MHRLLATSRALREILLLPAGFCPCQSGGRRSPQVAGRGRVRRRRRFVSSRRPPKARAALGRQLGATSAQSAALRLRRLGAPKLEIGFLCWCRKGQRSSTAQALLGPSSLPERAPNKLLPSDSPAGNTGRSLGTETSWTEPEPLASGNQVVPGSLLLSLRRAPTCRRGGPRGSDGQAGRSGPFGLQRGHASFPAKLEGGGSVCGRSAPQPRPRAPSRAEGLPLA